MTDAREQDTKLELYKLFCANLAWSTAGVFVISVAVLFVTVDRLTLSFIVPWFSIVTVILFVRFYLAWLWRNSPSSAINVDRRMVVGTVLTTMTSICFGVLGYVATSADDPSGTLLVVGILAGLGAGAAVVYSHLVYLYLLYLIPLLIPVSVKLYGFEDSSYKVMAALIVFFIPFSFLVSRSIFATIMRSISLRYDNLELLDRVQQEKQRAENSLAQMEEANFAKSKFLAAASHDVRQPLHSLRLFAATLEMQTNNSQHQKLVSQINSSVKSLEGLFNALLDISKLDAGTVDVEKQNLHLDLLFNKIRDDLLPIAKDKRIKIIVEPSEHVVYTDPVLLERLLNNIVSNAIRYTETGSVTIASNCSPNKREVDISVADTGIGIARDDQNRIFEEFVQIGNSERDRSQGIGLGLSIVKRLSELLDVTVRVDSEPGNGSCFTATVASGDASSTAVSSINGEMDDKQIESLFVLVIDDEVQACAAMEGLLETWGCVVMAATSGDEAIEQLREISEVPDVIVSDYRLRNKENGGDAITKIRQALAKEIPGVILTGDIAPERLREINLLGLPILHKPCEPKALRSLLVEQKLSAQMYA